MSGFRIMQSLNSDQGEMKMHVMILKQSAAGCREKTASRPVLRPWAFGRGVLLFCLVAFILLQFWALSPQAVAGESTQRFVKTTVTVMDTRTGLMWASRDNGDDINWHEAEAYCRAFNGGGYNDWRMPTQKELATLFDLEAGGESGYYIAGNIDITGCCIWASDKSGAKVASFDFDYGNPDWGHPGSIIESRALPVRQIRP